MSENDAAGNVRNAVNNNHNNHLPFERIEQPVSLVAIRCLRIKQAFFYYCVGKRHFQLRDPSQRRWPENTIPEHDHTQAGNIAISRGVFYIYDDGCNRPTSTDALGISLTLSRGADRRCDIATRQRLIRPSALLLAASAKPSQVSAELCCEVLVAKLRLRPVNSPENGRLDSRENCWHSGV